MIIIIKQLLGVRFCSCDRLIRVNNDVIASPHDRILLGLGLRAARTAPANMAKSNITFCLLFFIATIPLRAFYYGGAHRFPSN